MTLRRGIPLLLCVCAGILYAAISLRMWTTFQTPSWDLGIFTQLAKAYASFEAPIVPIKGEGFNLLGDHFHPILILLAPMYWIYPSGLSLLLAQAGLFALAIYPVARLAISRLGTLWGSLVGVSFVASWGIINAVWSQFHEIAFAVPLMAWGLVAFLEGKLNRSLILIGLLVFVKEDLGLTVAMFGAVIYLADRTKIRQACAIALWGISWFLLATQVILPALNPGGQWDYTSNVSVDPLAGWGLKLTFTCLIILTAGIIGLRSPIILLILPTLGWRFVGTVEYYWGWDFHYSAILIPILLCALIDGAGRYKVHASLLSLITTCVMLPVTQLFPVFEREGTDLTAVVEIAREYDVVVSDVTPLAYLVPDTTVYWSGSYGNVVPDAVVLSLQHHPQGAEKWAETNLGGDWVSIYDSDGWQIVTPSP